MTKLKLTGFTPADNVKYQPIEVPVPWRDIETGKEGELTVYAKAKSAPWTLFEVENQKADSPMQLIIQSLQKKDYELDEDKRPVPLSSSYERFQTLMADEDKEVPGAVLTEILQGLYVEYAQRRRPVGATEVPTTPAVPSSAASSRSGRGSAGKQRVRATTSSASQQTA